MKNRIKKILREQNQPNFDWANDVPAALSLEDIQQVANRMGVGRHDLKGVFESIYKLGVGDEKLVMQLLHEINSYTEGQNHIHWQEGHSSGQDEEGGNTEELTNYIDELKIEVENAHTKGWNEGYEGVEEEKDQAQRDGFKEGKGVGFEQGYNKAIEDKIVQDEEDYEYENRSPYDPKDYDGGYDE